MEIEHVKGKIMEGMPGFPRQYGPVRSDHQPGIPFFPQETARDSGRLKTATLETNIGASKTRRNTAS